MKIRGVLLAVTAAGVLLGAGAAPAFAAGPTVPAGCSFDQATGVLTCVTTATNNTTFGPLNTGVVTSPATVDGFTVQQICTAVFFPLSFTSMNLVNLTLNVTVTTTTTTERHGLQGKVFDTSTATSSVITGTQGGSGTSCSF